MMTHPNFWTDQNTAKQVTKEISQTRESIDHINKLDDAREDLETYIGLLDDHFDTILFQEAIVVTDIYNIFVQKAEISCLLNDKYDHHDALFTIHSGAGGTEAQDWASMLLRMYERWALKNKFGFSIVDIADGEEAGIKSVTVEITGNYVYGLLKSEIGIHRLVRMSPFNSQGKRQTSFASVYVYPEMDDDIVIDIDPKDIRIDTFHASGSGGQHVNTTDSAIRITHIPTNIVASCQNQRSQIQNKDKAMAMLKSRLYTYYEDIRDKEKKENESAKTDNGWGNQIRSYVFQPYQMVKDHRTNFESGTVDKVMDGDLDGFIYAWLKEQKKVVNK